MRAYRLAIDGDAIEKHYWSRFIQNEFPSYEEFWIKLVVPLSNRPRDIHFKTDQELKKIGKTSSDVCIAQLHYSVLRHLARVYDILSAPHLNLDDLTEGMVRICGAQDVAFELLERYKHPEKYCPWLEKKNDAGDLGGKEAREQWQKSNSYPLQHLRDYRNHLVHGRLMPGLNVYLPKIGSEQKYFDWRLITDPENNPGLDPDDLLPAKNILESAWRETLQYLEDNWQRVLLKNEIT